MVQTLFAELHAERKHVADLEACRQVACADVILLNKVDALAARTEAVGAEAAGTDAATEAAVGELRRVLSSLNALAPVHCTSRSRVPLEPRPVQRQLSEAREIVGCAVVSGLVECGRSRCAREASTSSAA